MDEENSKLGEQSNKSENTITSRTNGKLVWCRNKFFVVTGLIFLVGAFPYAVLQLTRCPWLPQNLACTYVALVIIPFALVLFFGGMYPDWVKKRRTVEPEELDNLYSEIDRYGENAQDSAASQRVERAIQERTRLQSFKGRVFEIDALPLRQALVYLYKPERELIAKARRELELLEEYTSVVDEEEGEDWRERITGIIDDLEETIDGSEEDEENKKRKVEELDRTLRAELKSLRETVAWYDRTWAIGEWMRTCVTYWVSATVIVTMLIGILPIVHKQGNFNLCIMHWLVLGIAGALLAILLRLHRLDLPELGETEGKQLLQGTVRSIAIGAVTAILLYAAIWGEAIDGKIFPDFPTNRTSFQVQQVQAPVEAEENVGTVTENQVEGIPLKNIGLSIFWAIFAGLSPGVFRRMYQVAESSLGTVKSESGDE